MRAGIEYRHFYFQNGIRIDEDSDELNERYVQGACEIGCRAIRKCLDFSGLSERDIDLFVLCSSTGYTCPDISSRLIGNMGFRSDIQRAPLIGLGCGGALPSLQRACDFAQSRVGQIALVLTVEICSACYYRDDTLETVVGNAICADGAAAALLIGGVPPDPLFPQIVDFESFLDPAHLGSVGFEHRNGKLRIVLGSEVRHLAPRLMEGALDPLLARNGLSQSDVRFWVVHPGGRRVIDSVQKHFGLSDSELQFSNAVLRKYGNMSSATVMFALDEVVRNGNPKPDDWGVMMAMGPGMAAEAALIRW
jgi:predicted naringenin-chalcone synthase